VLECAVPSTRGAGRGLAGLLLYAALAATLGGIHTKLPFNELLLQAGLALLLLVSLATGGAPGGTLVGRALAPILWAGVALAGVRFASAVLGVDPGLGLVEAVEAILLVGLALVAALCHRGLTQVRRTAHLLLLLGVLISGPAIYFYWGEVGNFAEPAMRSTFGNKNHLAGYLGMVLPLAVALYLSAGALRERLAYGSTTTLLGTILLLTYSRAGWASAALGIVVAVALCVPLTGARRLARGFPLAAFVLVSTLLVSSGSLGQAAAVGSQALGAVSATALGAREQGTVAPRLDYWQGALRIFLERPWLGTGPGTFQVVFPEYQQDSRYYSKYPHNFLLQEAADSGLLGLAAALALLLAVARVTWGNVRATSGGEGRPVAAGLAGGIVASVAHNLVEVDWNVPSLAILFWFEVGLLLALVLLQPGDLPRDEVADRAGVQPARPGPALRLATLGPAAILLLWTAAQAGSQFSLEQAREARGSLDVPRAQAWLSAARALNPWSGEPLYQQADLGQEQFEASGDPARLEEGLTAARAMTALSPRHRAYQALLARLYLDGAAVGMNDVAAAIPPLEQVALRGEAFQSPHAHLHLAEVYLGQGRRSEAAALYRRLMAAFPQGIDTPQADYGRLSAQELGSVLLVAHLALGRLAFEEGDGATAREQYLAGLRLKEQVPDLTVRRAQEAEANLALGIIAYRSGDVGQAEGFYRRSLALDGENPAAHFNLGVLLLEARRPGEALVALGQSLRLSPSHPSSYYYEGLAYIQRGEQVLARRALEEAVRLDPGLLAARRELERLLERPAGS